MSKQISVEINGVKYTPDNVSSTADKPFGEPEVNYRALVNDKLRDFDTFCECQDGEIELGDKLSLCFASDSYANNNYFIIAGRIQEVLKGLAFYGGNNERPLYLSLYTDTTWEEVYHLLIDNEYLIETGI